MESRLLAVSVVFNSLTARKGFDKTACCMSVQLFVAKATLVVKNRIGTAVVPHPSLLVPLCGLCLCTPRSFCAACQGCTTSAMNGAAYNSHLEVVRWLHENRTEVGEKLTETTSRKTFLFLFERVSHSQYVFAKMSSCRACFVFVAMLIDTRPSSRERDESTYSLHNVFVRKKREDIPVPY